jgi:hypothetical protein
LRCSDEPDSRTDPLLLHETEFELRRPTRQKAPGLASQAGLPDGVFSHQKSQFGQFFEGLKMEKIGVFYDLLEYITDVWYILWPCGNLVAIFSPHFVYCVKKIWQPCSQKNLAALQSKSAIGLAG